MTLKVRINLVVAVKQREFFSKKSVEDKSPFCENRNNKCIIIRKNESPSLDVDGLLIS